MVSTGIGFPEMTESILEHWMAVCTNEGHGTLHDPITWARLPLPASEAAPRHTVA
jgi:hypothetical protein